MPSSARVLFSKALLLIEKWKTPKTLLDLPKCVLDNLINLEQIPKR